jgi:hypothetical protein
MTERLLDQLRDLRKADEMEIEVRYEGGDRKQVRHWLGQAFRLAAQGNGRLDGRMARAFQAAFSDNLRRAVIIGTDIPGISADMVRRAFNRLLEKELVLGPAADGGYYLIGLRHSSFERARPLLSAEIPWGTDRVLKRTENMAAEAGLSYDLLETLQDIDRPEDLPHWEEICRMSSGLRPSGGISVIIPTLNEAAEIEAALGSLKNAFNVEAVVADGGSTDGTPDKARRMGARVLHSTRGRAVQMNIGAAAAAGETLLFLHADTRLPPGFEFHVRRAIDQPGVSAGAFELAIDAPNASLRIIEWMVNLRSRKLQMPYGDQGIFVSRALFRRMGGFKPMPIMEDFDFVRRLGKRGTIVLLPLTVQTAARRWLHMGIWRTWLINQLIVIGYVLKMPPERLAALYHRNRNV